MPLNLSHILALRCASRHITASLCCVGRRITAPLCCVSRHITAPLCCVSRRITAAPSPTTRSAIPALAAATLLASCAIKDDIPYPIVEAAITAIAVEGQCNADDSGPEAATIDKAQATITINVSDTVDIERLRITQLTVTNDATITPPTNAISPTSFPSKGFDSPAPGDNTAIDFSSGSATLRLTTYQDYDWTLRVRQVIIPEVLLTGQVGDAVIDATNHNIVIYVSATQPLNAIAVQRFRPAGQHCTVSPDPTATPTYDFSQMRTFTVTPGNGKGTATWQVFVYHTEARQQTTASVFARSVSATVSGTCATGVTPTVEYRQQGTATWQTLPATQVTVSGSRFTAELTALNPGATYEYQVTVGTDTTTPQTFTTVEAQTLTNGDFEQWHIEGSGKNALYCPWPEGATAYWDSGNHGATTVGSSNTTYVDEGGRRFANLESKYIVIKFAAGNIFTGDYLETDGTNGVLNFGRPFTAFPTKMSFDFRYHTAPITRTAGDWKEAYGDYITRELYEGLKGKPDSCNVYVALGDWPSVDYKGQQCAYLIRTRPSALHLMDMSSPNLIAYGQMTCGRDVTTWTTETIDINYRVRDRRPTTIIVVASSSKYGDYFTGGEGSLLQIDNINLLYE